MQIITTKIPGLLQFIPAVHRDHRGFFAETWREEWRVPLCLDCALVQDNHARSEEKGVLRGLHFQAPPAAQTKIVWVTQGAVFDVAVDLRAGSPTYGQWESVVLTAENAIRFVIPRGFAHGYMTLEPGTEFHYKVDNYYSPAHEGGLCWNDPTLNIPWPDITPVLSDKDKVLPPFAEFTSPFTFSA